MSALAVGAVLIAAACGSDDDSGGGATTTAGGATTTAAGGATTTAAGGATTTAGGATTTNAESGEFADPSPACEPDSSIDSTAGKNAGQFTADLQCGLQKPVKAEGDPVVIGFQNHVGDPAGSFPEYTAATEAAVKFINEELGGIGSNLSEGKAGRPIKLETCLMAVNPADSQKCANELAGKDPLFVINGLNFFGNQFPIYQQAGVPVIVGTPITLADFTGPGFAIGAGGGCLGVHTGLVWAVTQHIKAERVAVPWADTPPGVTCYYDLEKKPLDVLNGTTKGTSELAGSMPNLVHMGTPIKPASPDVTPQVTQVLDFKPTGIIFSGQGADCWNLVDGLGRQGWTPQQVPLILSGACIDFQKMTAAGDLAKDVYFIGSAGASLSNPDAIENPIWQLEAKTYLEKAKQYGMQDADITKGFAAAGWQVLMSAWEQANILVNAGKDLSQDSYAAQMKATDGNHYYGSVPFGCATAPAPYTAVCASDVSLLQWDGTNLNPVIGKLSGLDLVAGTELIPGPS